FRMNMYSLVDAKVTQFFDPVNEEFLSGAGVWPRVVMRVGCPPAPPPAGWLGLHESRDVGRVEVKAPTRDEVIEKIKGEIRYRLELCPCTGETYQHIDVEVIEAPRQA